MRIITDKTFSTLEFKCRSREYAESSPQDNRFNAGPKTIFCDVANAQYQSAANSFNIVTWQTPLVAHAAFEIDRADALFERRRLQNYLAFAVSDAARAVEHDAIVAADQVYENYGEVGGFSTVRNHRATLTHFAFIKWRSVDGDDHIGAHVDQFVGWIMRVKPVCPEGFVIPEIFTDCDAKAMAFHWEVDAGDAVQFRR